MNKKIVLNLLMIASLYGQMASANEVVISKVRLQNISGAELSMLVEAGAVKFNQNRAILNLQTLDSILKDGIQTERLAKEANIYSTRFVPYGATAEISDTHEQLAEKLSVRFVPYGNS